MTFQQVLVLDISGQPTEWLSPKDAVTAYANGKVAWDLGDAERIFRGGYSRHGVQSMITVKPIIAIAGSEKMSPYLRNELPLGEEDNESLFKRDRHTCAYCATKFESYFLTRDHILARSRGGRDTWMNTVTACRDCNQKKGSKLVENFRPLVYLPYIPNRAEHFLLSGRTILVDQHEYLAAHLPKTSRLL